MVLNSSDLIHLDGIHQELQRRRGELLALEEMTPHEQRQLRDVQEAIHLFRPCRKTHQALSRGDTKLPRSRTGYARTRKGKPPRKILMPHVAAKLPANQIIGHLSEQLAERVEPWAGYAMPGGLHGGSSQLLERMGQILTPDMYVLEADWVRYYDHANLDRAMGVQDQLLRECELGLSRGARKLYREIAWPGWDGFQPMEHELLLSPHLETGNPLSSMLAVLLPTLAVDRPLILECKRRGCIPFRYLDNWWILCPSYKVAKRIEVLLTNRSRDLGLTLNQAKSRVLRPGQHIEVLGHNCYHDGQRVRWGIPSETQTSWIDHIPHLIRHGESPAEACRGWINYYWRAFAQQPALALSLDRRIEHLGLGGLHRITTMWMTLSRRKEVREITRGLEHPHNMLWPTPLTHTG